MPIINRIAEFHDQMKSWRHDLHAHPELGLEEVRTSGIVAQRLREFGVEGVRIQEVVSLDKEMMDTLPHVFEAQQPLKGSLSDLEEPIQQTSLWRDISLSLA